MAYNEELALRIRQTILDMKLPDFSEKKMFGGIAYLYKGKMTVGIVQDELMVRVPEDKMAQSLASPHVREMDFTKKPMKELVFVNEDGFRSEEQLMHWINLGLEHAKTKVK